MLPISWHTQPQIHTQKVLLSTHTHTHKIYDTLTLSLINKIKYTMMYVAKIKRRGKIRKQNRKEEFAKWHHLLFTKINSKTLRRWKGYKIKEWWRRWEGGRHWGRKHVRICAVLKVFFCIGTNFILRFHLLKPLITLTCDWILFTTSINFKTFMVRH